MTHGSLFSGIGGFDLAAEWMGWENVFHCEKNEFCQKVLKYYWPNAELFKDITASSFLKYRGRIDVLTGGFPCQPFSTSGEQKGESDIRYLYPEMLRAIREIKPRWVVAENVRGLTSQKFKKVFQEILSSMEVEGYETLPPLLIPASAIGADHERYRIWFVAYSASVRQQGSWYSGNAVEYTTKENRETDWPKLLFQGQSVSHLFKHDDGIPERLVDYPVSEYRERANTSNGNAIVPRIAYEIFRAIEQYDSLMALGKSIGSND